MGRFHYRMLAAVWCILQASACAHHAPRAGQTAPPPGRAPDGASMPDDMGSRSRQSHQEQPETQTPPPSAAGKEEDASGSTQQRLAAAGPGVSAGMPVQNEAGKPLGFVVDVLPGPAGTEESGYVVIAGGAGGTTPVPYGAARSMVQDDSVVIAQSRFAGAPKVKQSQIEDPSATAWKAQADQYWNGNPEGARKQPQEERPQARPPDSESEADPEPEPEQ